MRRRKKTKILQDSPESSVSSQQAGTEDVASQDLSPSWVSNQLAGNSSMASICIFTNNCRGYSSKKESIQKYVCELIQPEVILLEETMLRNKSKIKHKDYLSFCLNRAEGAGGGGIATLIANTIKQHATRVAENNKKEEYSIVRLEHIKPALNIVHVYGRVESRTSPEKVLEGWAEILKELSHIEDSQEAILMVGDWNRAVGSGAQGVEGNKSQVSYGGSLIRDLVSTGNYFILNNLELAGVGRGQESARGIAAQAQAWI